MSKIFIGLSIFTVGLTSVAFLTGYTAGDYNAATFRLRALQQDLYRIQGSVAADPVNIQRQKEDIEEGYGQLEPIRQSAIRHTLTGLVATLAAIFLGSISVTYFIGTSRWCREVAEAYGMDEDIIRRSKALKRRAFPSALIAIFASLVIAVLGAAADPGTLRPGTEKWVTPHHFVALASTFVILFCIWKQVRYISANHDIINEILEIVSRVRRENGLEDAETTGASPTQASISTTD